MGNWLQFKHTTSWRDSSKYSLIFLQLISKPLIFGHAIVMVQSSFNKMLEKARTRQKPFEQQIRLICVYSTFFSWVYVVESK